jgi:hypothetical protein
MAPSMSPALAAHRQQRIRRRATNAYWRDLVKRTPHRNERSTLTTQVNVELPSWLEEKAS